MTLTRRLFIAGLGTAAILGPKCAYAGAPRPKLLVIILRGAMDGLAAFPKLDDPHLEAHRSALIPESHTPIDEGFAIHGALKTLAAWYGEGSASVIHAIAGPWRERSHFLAQDFLETGDVKTPGSQGWLNRALARDPSLSAVSIGASPPLILAGPAPTSSWSPAVLPEASEDTVMRLLSLYDTDPALQAALSQAVETDAVASSMEGGESANRRNAYETPLIGAAHLLGATGGPDIAVVGLEGWDTHSGQSGKLTRRFDALDAALAATRTALGDAWATTAIACVTEFGRTVRVNGSGGTDHGTAGAAFLAGGGLKGGRVLGDWPGLAPQALYENRDLYPANNLHGLFKGLLAQLYGFDRKDLNAVFPETQAARPLSLS